MKSRLEYLKYKDKITIGAPFYNSVWCWKIFSKSILDQDYNKKYINIVWVDNGSTDNTKDLLLKFKKKYEKDYNSIKVLDCPRVKEKSRGMRKYIRNIVNGTNMIADNREKDSDLILMGSDCIPPQNGLKKLLDMKYLGADIAGGITVIFAGGRLDKYGRKTVIPVFSIFNALSPSSAFKGVLFHKTEKDLLTLPVWLKDKVIRVMALGTGFCLIRDRVLKKQRWKVNYRFGEDLYFCWTAHLNGFKIYADTSLWYDHLHYDYQVKKKKLGYQIIYKGETDKRERWIV